MAEACVQTNELRSVYNVAEDLLALQLVCTTSSKCAVKFWPSVAQLCSQKVRQLAENAFDAAAVLRHFKTLVMPHFALKDFNPALLGRLPPEILAVYVQLQIEKTTSITHSKAKRQFLLTAEDLQKCPQITRSAEGSAETATNCLLQNELSYTKQVCQGYNKMYD